MICNLSLPFWTPLIWRVWWWNWSWNLLVIQLSCEKSIRIQTSFHYAGCLVGIPIGILEIPWGILEIPWTFHHLKITQGSFFLSRILNLLPAIGQWLVIKWVVSIYSMTHNYCKWWSRESCMHLVIKLVSITILSLVYYRDLWFHKW